MPALKDAMLFKTEQELSLIQRACTIAEDGFLATLPEIKEGMTESEVAALLEYNMRKFGASGTLVRDHLRLRGGRERAPSRDGGDEAQIRRRRPHRLRLQEVEGYCSD